MLWKALESTGENVTGAAVMGVTTGAAVAPGPIGAKVIGAPVTDVGSRFTGAVGADGTGAILGDAPVGVGRRESGAVGVTGAALVGAVGAAGGR